MKFERSDSSKLMTTWSHKSQEAVWLATGSVRLIGFASSEDLGLDETIEDAKAFHSALGEAIAEATGEESLELLEKWAIAEDLNIVPVNGWAVTDPYLEEKIASGPTIYEALKNA